MVGEAKCKLLGCKGTPIITDYSTGEVLCGACGCVLEEKAHDGGFETFEDLGDFYANSKRGNKQSLQMIDPLSSVMSDKDSFGNNIKGPLKRVFERLEILDSRANPKSVERTMKRMLVTLNMMKTRMSLSDAVTEHAAYLLRKVSKEGLIVGREGTIMLLACIYISCRLSGVTRSLDEIAQAGNSKKKHVFNAVSIIRESLGINLDPPSPASFISKIAGDLGIKEKIQRDAIDLVRMLEKRESNEGKNPVAIAACCLYIESVKNGLATTQNQIANAAGVTTVTLRNRVREIKDELRIY